MIKKRRGNSAVRKRKRSPLVDDDGDSKESSMVETVRTVSEVERKKKVKKETGGNDLVVSSKDRKKDAEEMKRYAETFFGTKSINGNVTEDQNATGENIVEKDRTNTKKRGALGPMKGSTNIRISSRFDYQPDICKDYYETGFCAYGDNCKFAHIREDFKSGWQIEKEFKEKQKEEKLKQIEQLQNELDNSDQTQHDQTSNLNGKDGLPFACYVCRKPFDDPVVTECKHYFCESCILQHYTKKSKFCPICKNKLSGIFNTAHELNKK